MLHSNLKSRLLAVFLLVSLTSDVFHLKHLHQDCEVVGMSKQNVNLLVQTPYEMKYALIVCELPTS